MTASRRAAPLWRSTLAVARKELREGFRDRQTLMYSVALPIALYPVLFWMMIQGALLVQGRREHTRVAVALSAQDPELARALGAALERSGSAKRAELDPLELREPPALASRAEARAWLAAFEAHDPRGPDALLHAGPPEPQEEGGAPLALFYDSTRSRSAIARARVEERVRILAGELRRESAAELGLDPGAYEPIESAQRNVAAREEMGAYLLSFVLPMVLVVMTVMGAFFPAVDLTAGERERGTMETTLLTPIPRMALHQGKILAVAASAVLATALNLLALGLSAGHLMNMLASGIAFRVELPVTALVSVAPFALLFAFFVSAVLTAIAALARTFKEGQALLGPVQLVFILPAMAGALPGLELSPGTAAIPVVGIVLAFRTLLRGEVLPLEFALTAVALCGFAILASALALRVLSREEIQTSDRRVSLRGLFALFRSPAGTR